jgi:hypothetical protein
MWSHHHAYAVVIPPNSNRNNDGDGGDCSSCSGDWVLLMVVILISISVFGGGCGDDDDDNDYYNHDLILAYSLHLLYLLMASECLHTQSRPIFCKYNCCLNKFHKTTLISKCTMIKHNFYLQHSVLAM